MKYKWNLPELVKEGTAKLDRCYQCIRSCNPAEILYCITKALVTAAQGDVEHIAM